jgi:hypothetical protein
MTSWPRRALRSDVVAPPAMISCSSSLRLDIPLVVVACSRDVKAPVACATIWPGSRASIAATKAPTASSAPRHHGPDTRCCLATTRSSWVTSTRWHRELNSLWPDVLRHTTFVRYRQVKRRRAPERPRRRQRRPQRADDQDHLGDHALLAWRRGRTRSQDYQLCVVTPRAPRSTIVDRRLSVTSTQLSWGLKNASTQVSVARGRAAMHNHRG